MQPTADDGFEDPFNDDDDSDWEDIDEASKGIPTSQSSYLVPNFRKLVIVSSTGIFRRTVRWCMCEGAVTKDIQLLRCRIFPATFKNPSSAFTFEVLDHFRLDSLECNNAAMNFMSKLVRITNEVFPSTVPVSNTCNHHMIRILTEVVMAESLSRAPSCFKTMEGPSQSHPRWCGT
jgi:hypothetical protein